MTYRRPDNIFFAGNSGKIDFLDVFKILEIPKMELLPADVLAIIIDQLRGSSVIQMSATCKTIRCLILGLRFRVDPMIRRPDHLRKICISDDVLRLMAGFPIARIIHIFKVACKLQAKAIIQYLAYILRKSGERTESGTHDKSIDWILSCGYHKVLKFGAFAVWYKKMILIGEYEQVKMHPRSRSIQKSTRFGYYHKFDYVGSPGCNAVSPSNAAVMIENAMRANDLAAVQWCKTHLDVPIFLAYYDPDMLPEIIAIAQKKDQLANAMLRAIREHTCPSFPRDGPWVPLRMVALLRYAVRTDDQLLFERAIRKANNRMGIFVHEQVFRDLLRYKRWTMLRFVKDSGDSFPFSNHITPHIKALIKYPVSDPELLHWLLYVFLKGIAAGYILFLLCKYGAVEYAKILLRENPESGIPNVDYLDPEIRAEFLH